MKKGVENGELKLNTEIEAVINQWVDFPWAKSLGSWSLNVIDNCYIISEKKMESLGYAKEAMGEEEGYEFILSKIHPDDLEKVSNFRKAYLEKNSGQYTVDYRVLADSGQYIWFYEVGMISQRTDEGKPKTIFGFTFDVTKLKEIELENEKLRKSMENVADLDQLTRVLNRKSIIEKIDLEIAKNKRYHQEFSIIVFNIDNFKHINETYGQSVGDVVLKEVAYTIKERIRELDFIGRLGSDEFLLILPSTNREEGEIVAESIREIIEVLELPEAESVTVSAGGAEYINFYSKDDLLNEVDELLAEAKINGKNCVKF